MTVSTTGGSASPWGDLGDVGLEDVSASDIQIPRIQIDGENACFVDSSTKIRLDSLECVIMGLVKQRIMWDSEVENGDKPQCKSPNHSIGYPQMRTDIPARKQFPWAKSNFDPADFPTDDNGQIKLPCDTCTFSQWGADKSKPPCSEQFTFVIAYKTPEGDMRPGIISFQRSGAKAAKSYAGAFATSRQPMFTVWSRITLKPESRGKVRYAIPSFTRGGQTDSDEWAAFAANYRQVREFLHQAPRAATKEEDDRESAARSSRPAPASAASATKIEDDDPWATVAAPASSVSAPDDDLPF